MSYDIHQVSGGVQFTDDITKAGVTIGSAISARHEHFGPICKSFITLDNLAQTITNGASEFTGTKIFTFPKGRILVLGTVATLKQKTTSTLASTITTGTAGAFGVGTVTASNASLTSTMVDLLPSVAFASSATINVAGTAVSTALAASAQFDGTTTAKDMYLNTSVATNSADGSMTVSGFIKITWIFIGAY